MPLETDKQNGFEADISQLLKTGVFPEAFDRRIPMWASVDGVRFNRFGMKRKEGREEKIDVTSGPVRGLTATNEFSTKVAYIGDLTSIYSWRLDQTTYDTVGTGYNLLENASNTVWDSGSTTWDSGNTTWDAGVNVASQWSFETFGSWVLAANGVDKPVIKKGNVNFNTLHDDEVSGATVNAGSSSYAVNDTIVMTGGSGSGFDVTVTEVSAGVVTAFEITDFGSGYADGETLTQSSTSGSGIGFTCDITVPDAPFNKVKVFKKQGPHVLAFNYTTDVADYPYSFAWCAADDVDTWVAAATNTAGSLLIREAETPLLCARQLGSNLAVYNDSQMFLVTYVGLPNYFGYRVALENDVGAVSVNSSISAGRLNYGLSRDGFFVTDGANVTAIGRDNGMDDYIRENVAEEEYAQVAGYNNAAADEVVWVLPIGENKPTKEIYFSYETKQWGIRTSSLTALLERGVFNNNLSADADGKVYYEGSTPSLSQTIIATTKAHDLNDPDRIKEINSIRVGKEGSGMPQIRVGWAETIDATPTYTESFFVDATFSENLVRTAGRYLFLEVSSDGQSDDWILTDMVIQGRMESPR